MLDSVAMMWGKLATFLARGHGREFGELARQKPKERKEGRIVGGSPD